MSLKYARFSVLLSQLIAMGGGTCGHLGTKIGTILSKSHKCITMGPMHPDVRRQTQVVDLYGLFQSKTLQIVKTIQISEYMTTNIYNTRFNSSALSQNS